MEKLLLKCFEEYYTLAVRNLIISIIPFKREAHQCGNKSLSNLASSVLNPAKLKLSFKYFKTCHLYRVYKRSSELILIGFSLRSFRYGDYGNVPTT